MNDIETVNGVSIGTLAKFYFNDTQVGNTSTFSNYDPMPPPTPIDDEVLAGAMGSTSSISSVSVWQASAADDLVQ